MLLLWEHQALFAYHISLHRRRHHRHHCHRHCHHHRRSPPLHHRLFLVR